MLLSTVASAYAQLSTASVSGSVQDTTGARIPAVTIRLLNLQTGNENATTTGNTGEFLLPGVLPGLYSLQIRHDGFAAVHLTGLNLNVGELRKFVIKLRLSSVEETVEVDASGQNLNAEDAQMSTVIDSHLVREIPLNGRSFQDLIAMTPGSIPVSPQVPRTGGFSVNGQSPDTNLYWVDGISGNFGSGPLDAAVKVPAAGQYASLTSLGTTHGLVAVDALDEFRVIASTSSAEYGGMTGGQFSLITRQGSSPIHATAYAYLRNSYFDAQDWFGAYNNDSNGDYYYQQDIGGSLSAPLTLDRRHAARASTHFFGSYDEVHVQQRTAPYIEYLPNIAWLERASIPVQAAFASLPASSKGVTGAPLIPEVDLNPSPPSFIRSMDYRIDHNFSSRLSAFLRFGDTPSGSESLLLRMTGNEKLSNQSATLGLDAQISSHAGNELRIGWARATANSLTLTPPLTYDPNLPPSMNTFAGEELSTALGSRVASSQTRSVLYFQAPGIGSVSTWSDAANNVLRQEEVRDSYSLQHGTHLIQFGVDVRNLHSAVRPLPWAIEADYFSAQSVLANSADALVLTRTNPSHPAFQQFASFVQDRWNIGHNLNVSAGLRWDIAPPPHASDGRDAFRVNEVPETQQTWSISPRGASLWNTDWHAFGPRIGAAWHLDQNPKRELILRGGLGVIFDTVNRAGAPAFTGAGFSSANVLHNASIPAAATAPLNPEVPGTESLGYAFPRNLQTPYSLQWNITVEQAVGAHQSLSASYVGASGRDLLIPLRRKIASSEIPLKEVVTFPRNLASRFDSLQLAYQGRYRSMLTWMSSYVWAHSLDYDSPNPWTNPTRGNADTDVRDNLQAAASWALPSVGTRGTLHNALSGWSIDGRYFLRSSYPITVLGNVFDDPVTGEQFYTGSNLLRNKPLYLFKASVPGGRMLNGGPEAARGAFQLPSGDTEGNAPRNIARGFDAQQLSLSFERDIHLRERLYLQLRADVFNIANSPDFGYVVPVLTDQLFGQTTLSLNQSYGQSGSLYQPGGPRSVQWMFRLRW